MALCLQSWKRQRVGVSITPKGQGARKLLDNTRGSYVAKSSKIQKPLTAHRAASRLERSWTWYLGGWEKGSRKGSDVVVLRSRSRGADTMAKFLLCGLVVVDRGWYNSTCVLSGVIRLLLGGCLLLPLLWVRYSLVLFYWLYGGKVALLFLLSFLLPETNVLVGDANKKKD